MPDKTLNTRYLILIHLLKIESVTACLEHVRPSHPIVWFVFLSDVLLEDHLPP